MVLEKDLNKFDSIAQCFTNPLSHLNQKIIQKASIKFTCLQRKFSF